MNKYVTTVLFIALIGAGSVGATGAVLNYLRGYQAPERPAPAGMVRTAQGPMKHVYLTLDTFPNFPSAAWIKEHHYHYVRNPYVPTIDTHPDWVLYGPTSNLVVPAYSEVTITIHQFDSGETLLNDFYAHVEGTIGNTMTVDGKTMAGIHADQVAHTFTIHGASQGQPYLFVSVPLMKLPDDVVSAGADNGFVPHSHVITFSFYVKGPGHYVWQCEYPCGSSYDGFGGAMSTNGYMNGNFDVVA
jgi:hypothetical protein